MNEKIRPGPWPEVRYSASCDILLHMQKKVVVASAPRVLAKLGFTLEEARQEVLKALDPGLNP